MNSGSPLTLSHGGKQDISNVTLDLGDTYAVAVDEIKASQTCRIKNPSGRIRYVDVADNVKVKCYDFVELAAAAVL